MADSKTIEIDLGAQQADVERRVASGDYEDASDVIREALHALDERDAALDAQLRAQVKASLADPRPSVPIEDVFSRLHARLEQIADERRRGR